ncbi:MAG: class II aldolase/adducin family protein [Thermodesulfovibrionales bacterium]
MQRLINKYLNKLNTQGLSHPEDTTFAACDDRVYSNRKVTRDLMTVFDKLNINSIIIAKPKSPYREILEYLVVGNGNCIIPQDCETRTFLHDIPVIREITAMSLIDALSKRRSAVSKDGRIISYGMISPEQAYVNFSSTCFSLFIKYFLDQIESQVETRTPDIFRYISDIQHISLRENSIFEVGRALVSLRLVDSYFGNISFVEDNAIHITQTGSSLDELEGNIDIVPLNMTSTTGVTSSSEFSTHRAVYQKTDFRYILHGHPPFTVIQSMLCDEKGCMRGDMCYQSCKKDRYFEGIPIVSGEIGTGPTALVNTVPDAMTRSHAVIVYGHGVFVASRDGFQGCLDEVIRIENMAIQSLRYRLCRKGH